MAEGEPIISLHVGASTVEDIYLLRDLLQLILHFPQRTKNGYFVRATFHHNERLN